MIRVSLLIAAAATAATVSSTTAAEVRRLLNVSMRATITQASPSVVLGFVADSDAPVLVRVVGPSLARFQGISPLTSPIAHIYVNGELTGRIRALNELNEESRQELARVSGMVGAFPLNPNSEDLVMVLQPRMNQAFTFSIFSSGGSGDVLLEVYSVPSAVVDRPQNAQQGARAARSASTSRATDEN